MLRNCRNGDNNIVDLDWRVYFQVRVHQSLWVFQTLMIKEWRYCLTRLRFVLNVTPMIMSAIMNVVMAQDKEIQRPHYPTLIMFMSMKMRPFQGGLRNIQSVLVWCARPQSCYRRGQMYSQTTNQWWWKKISLEARQWCSGSPASDHSLEHLLLVWEASRPFPCMQQ